MRYILHYVSKMYRGGLETYIMELYRNIDRNKYQFHFAVHSEENYAYNDEIIKLGGKIIVFPKYSQNPIKYRRLWDTFWESNKEKYHAFHYHNNSLSNIESIRSATSRGFKNIIVHGHSSSAKGKKAQIVYDLLHKINQNYINNRKFTRLAVSEEAAIWMYGPKEVDRNNVRVVLNGINYDKFVFDKLKRESLRKDLNMKDDFVIGHVGNFRTVKNHEFLIKVYSQIIKKNKQSKLVLLGDGELKKDIIQYSKQLGVYDNVIFLGNKPNVTDYLNAMDTFVFPSLYEGLGLSAIEAQINGLPVIYSDTVPKIIEITEYCESLSLGDSYDNWSNKILNTMNLRNKSSFILKKFGIDNAVNSIVNIYNNL